MLPAWRAIRSAALVFKEATVSLIATSQKGGEVVGGNQHGVTAGLVYPLRRDGRMSPKHPRYCNGQPKYRKHDEHQKQVFGDRERISMSGRRERLNDRGGDIPDLLRETRGTGWRQTMKGACKWLRRAFTASSPGMVADTAVISTGIERGSGAIAFLEAFDIQSSQEQQQKPGKAASSSGVFDAAAVRRWGVFWGWACRYSEIFAVLTVHIGDAAIFLRAVIAVATVLRVVGNIFISIAERVGVFLRVSRGWRRRRSCLSESTAKARRSSPSPRDHETDKQEDR
ncbi:hypothetical protein B0H12DRAFT_1065784 [Mycena haematopus]|nr:hypothetical protein B0H12DRAFT_1065784 [Mycena haematopus]